MFNGRSSSFGVIGFDPYYENFCLRCMWYGVYYYFNKGQIDNKDMLSFCFHSLLGIVIL